MAGHDGWPEDAAALVAEQERLAGLAPTPWRLEAAEPAVGGCFVAYLPGGRGRVGQAIGPGWEPS